ncbi:hypothetical protein IWW38_004613 [Coemansia aciculifera]|uniref:Uncharacterized protein n=1 Tax=Coemansia aciculifera TaxID=417176 RepID=A0ACC1LYA8_9FUNG|nr:hypothetical protein IWW38_004613 [Coemansia aciculifera]
MDAVDHNADVLSILRQDPLQAALTSSTLRSFHISKQFSDNKAALTSLDYDISGNKCITTSLDETLRIYDCMGGKREQVLLSKKYGCNLAQFTSQTGCVAYASTKINDTIRYLSYDTNEYIRYFVGHTRRVTSLQRSPTVATVMMSAALDGVVNVWDLGLVKPASTVTPACTSGGGVEDRGISAAYDPSGMVIAVAVGSNVLQLYDVREVARGPFKSQSIAAEAGQALVAGIRFIPPLGDHLLLAMTDGSCHLLDSFSLQHCASLQQQQQQDKTESQDAVNGGAHGDTLPALDRMQSAFLGQNVTVTPDGKTVVAGGQNGSISYWDIARFTGADASGGASTSGQRAPVLVPDGVWNGSHDGSVGVCAFNQHILECITGAQSLAIWTSSTTF